MSAHRSRNRRQPAFLTHLALLALATTGLTHCDPGVPSLTSPNAPASPPGPVTAPKPLRLVCLFGDGRVPFQRAQAQYVAWRDAADPLVIAESQDAAGSVERQAAQLATLVQSPPAVLFLQPLALPPLAASLTTLRQARCRVVVFDPPANADFSPLADWVLVCDAQTLGKQAATAALDALRRRPASPPADSPLGRVLQFRGGDQDPFSLAVHQGFSSTLTAHPEAKLVHDAPTDWDPAKARLRFTEALRLQSPFHIAFAHDDFLAQAIHQEAIAAGLRDDLLIIGINGFHGPEGGLEMIRRQEIDATLLRPFMLDHIWSLATAPPQPQATASSPAQVLRFRARLVRPADLDHPDRLLPDPPQS